MKRSKKYQASFAKVEANKQYTFDDAIKLAKEVAYAKFDETVEVAVNLNLKKSHTIRDTVVLPNMFTAEKKILVFAKGDKAQEALDAGATFVGEADLVAKIRGGWLDFDVCVATPDMMKDVGTLGQILGRRGLMPNPKTRTVTMDIKGALEELKKGRVEYRADKAGVVHLPVGKVSMDPAKIRENIAVFMDELTKKKPSDIKGDFIRSIALSSTMGPGIKVLVREEA
jgi:large subunit ribosomal protein L1